RKRAGPPRAAADGTSARSSAPLERHSRRELQVSRPAAAQERVAAADVGRRRERQIADAAVRRRVDAVLQEVHTEVRQYRIRKAEGGENVELFEGCGFAKLTWLKMLNASRRS